MSAQQTIIAIDGTFASGKGTLAKALAAHYGFHYLDTGKLYRAAARDMLLAGEDPNDGGVATRFAKAIDPQSLDDPGLKQSEVAAAARDAGRTEAPLKPAQDSHLIDTTDLSVEAVMKAATTIIDAVLTP